MFARLRERVIAVWRRWWALIVAVALILCFISEQTGLTDRLLVLCGVADPHLPPKGGELQVHTLDVGNADALVLFCDGKTMLIDAGEHNDGDNVTEYLQHLGVTHLTYVIATHADALIVPVYTDGSYGIFRRANVVIGEALDPKAHCQEGLSEQAQLEQLTVLLRQSVYGLKEHMK